MINYTTFDSPFGTMGIARSSEGICRVLFPNKESVRERIQSRFPGVHIEEHAINLEEGVEQLREYFLGDRKDFTVNLDLHMPRFYHRVLEEVRNIPYGKTASYKDVAERVGNPGAVRAVGSANARNPIPIIIPCHRVISNDGSLGGYGGRLDWKYTLLNLEGTV